MTQTCVVKSAYAKVFSPGPKFSEINGPGDQFSRNFGPPDQNFWRTKISVTDHERVEFLIQEIELTHVRYCYCEAEVRSSSACERSVRITFVHSIFEGSPSKEGFHGTR